MLCAPFGQRRSVLVPAWVQVGTIFEYLRRPPEARQFGKRAILRASSRPTGTG